MRLFVERSRERRFVEEGGKRGSTAARKMLPQVGPLAGELERRHGGDHPLHPHVLRGFNRARQQLVRNPLCNVVGREAKLFFYKNKAQDKCGLQTKYGLSDWLLSAWGPSDLI